MMFKTAFQYHNHTSYDPYKMSGHGLDWANQPNVYKEYPGIEPIQLSLETSAVAKKLSSILKDYVIAEEAFDSFSIDDLSLLLRLTNTLTAKSSHPGGDFYYRSAASAGALYPTEIYVATHSVRELDDGLYHFAIHRHALFPLRIGDFSSYVVKHVGNLGDNIPIVMIFLTAIFFRSAWKYRDRSYRYHLLDTGHVLENLTMAFKALGLPFKLSYDFNDEQINHLLGLDDSKEVTLAVACIPNKEPYDQSSVQNLEKLPLEIQKASITTNQEVDYPAMRGIHQASSIVLNQKRDIPDMSKEIGLSADSYEKIPSSLTWPETVDYPDTLFQRRSHRRFIKNLMSKDCLMALVDTLCIKDFQDSDMASSYEESLGTGFIINKVNDFPSGLYLLNRANQSIGLVSPDVSTSQMARICLGQSWLADAAVHFLFMTNLDLLDQTAGPRGYRYAMMIAGRLGERLYVVSTAMSLGCCGIGAFYDMDAAKTIGLNDTSRLLYLVAVGTMK